MLFFIKSKVAPKKHKKAKKASKSRVAPAEAGEAQAEAPEKLSVSQV